jgi:hypothetical protein
MRWQQTTSCRFENALIVPNGSKTKSKASRSSQKEQGATTTHIKVKKPRNVDLKENFEFGSKIEGNKVILSLPIKTISEANCEQHWTTKHKRHKKQKDVIFWAFLEVKHLIKLPCTLTFVRYAPKFLDKHDNLPMSMKWICDALCAEITGDFRAGRADNSDQIEIKYDQVKLSVYGVKIIIEF